MQTTKTTPKRALSLLLTLCFMLSLFPALSVPARAANTAAPADGFDFRSGQTHAAEATYNGTSGTGTAHWNGSDTLTLTGFTYNVSATHLIKLPAGSTIKLAGTNTITSTSTAEDGYGIYSTGSLTVNSVDPSNPGSLTITAGGVTSGSSVGLCLYARAKDLTLTVADATVKANGGTSSQVSQGVEVSGTISVTGSGVLEGTGGTANIFSMGIMTTGTTDNVVGGASAEDLENDIRYDESESSFFYGTGTMAKYVKITAAGGGGEGGDTWEYPSATPGTPFAGGTGESGNPYQIATAQQLANLAYLVNTDNATYGSKHYKLTANIDLGGSEGGNWTPIGNAENGSNKFAGTFDGDGFEVQNIYINATAKHQGLFGHVGGSIKKLGVTGSITTSDHTAGGIAGTAYSNTTIENCYNTAAITALRNLGGIVGQLSSQNTISVKNCFNTGTITAKVNTNTTMGLGGIVGNISSGGGKTVENCYNTGNLVATDATGGSAGGIVGHMNSPGTPASTVKNCVSLGSSIAIPNGGQTDLGRIIGTMASGHTLEGLYYARGDMTINGSALTEGATTASNAKDGASVTVGTANQRSEVFTDAAGWDFTNTWNTGNATLVIDQALPMLKDFKTGTTFFTNAPTLPAAEAGGGDPDPGSATVSNYTFNGTVGTALASGPSSNRVTITLVDDTIKETLTGGQSGNKVFASMVQNLPAGLRTYASLEVSAGATSFVLVVAGTPTATASGALSIVIPGSILTKGEDITVTANASTKWSILPAADDFTLQFTKREGSWSLTKVKDGTGQGAYTADGISFDGDTLTLNDFNFATTAGQALITGDGAKIVLGGTSSITGSESGIEAGGNISFSGSGTLNTNGISISLGDLTISGGTINSVNINQGGFGAHLYRGESYGTGDCDVVITGGTLNATGGNFGLATLGGITVSGSGTLNAKSSGDFGIMMDTLAVTGNGKVTAEGSAAIMTLTPTEPTANTVKGKQGEGELGAVTWTSATGDFTAYFYSTDGTYQGLATYVELTGASEPTPPVTPPSSGGGGTTTTTTIPADTESKSTPVEITTSGNDVTLKLPDSKVEDIVKSADENVTFDLSKVKNAETAIIPIKAVETLSEENIGITVKLPEADITIAAEDLQDLADDAKAGENLRVEAEYISPSNLTAEQKEAVEGKRVIDINVFLGNRKVDVPVTVSIPYELADGEDPNGVCVWYMDDKGNLTKMTGTYDTETGLFTFYTDHQSYYLVGYEQPENHLCDAFTDIKGHWGFDAICYMAENGIMNGTSSTTFAPNTNLSRAMMVQILWNLEGKPAAGSATFTDVASGAWYADAVAWASANGIVNGYGNGLFGPEDSITREQMVTILRNYAEFKGMDVSATNDLGSFGDAGAVSGWALSSIQWAVEEEIIGGRPGGLIDPKGTATRAEIAQMMMNFMSK